MSCVRGCCDTQAAHFRSLSLTGWRKAESDRKQRAMERDHDAYRRLRKQGYQPKHTAGAATLEAHAETPQEITLGVKVPKKDRGMWGDVMASADHR